MENKCRVCLANSKNMVNIFEERRDLPASIAHMIFTCTGFKVEKGDSFPHSICPPCVKDAHNAFAIIKTYERSYQVFYEAHDTVLEEELSEDIIELSDSDDAILIDEQEEKLHLSENKAPTNEVSFQEESKTAHSEEVSDDKRNVCTQCDMSFRRPGLLGLHIRRHHTTDDTTSTNAVKGELRKKARQLSKNSSYTCCLCNKTFCSISNCRRHQKTHTGEKPFACELCQKPFVDTASVKRHLRTHTGERPFKCLTCQSAFSGASALRQHILIHTGEKPHKCDMCDKFFRARSDLRKHMWSHTGEKPFKCSQCERCFRHQKSVRKHVMLCHKDEVENAATS
ncbi:zinc finger protein 501 [Drosophila simulans]|uniref:Protein krueppel n=2 Tax=Drosophila simulans TaxID=7240 RepID=A0A0J9TEI7_DROSI|nr:zinc finger protein 501 [Drosophila simulans]KMY87830.1 uncharacterized protein Dsimw501_GD22773 [Drosophila simulans]